MAYVTSRWVTQLSLPVPMPIGLTFTFDWRVMLFATAASLATTFVFGLGPALQCARIEPWPSLKTGGLAAGRSRMQSGLVISQVALSTTLLVTAAVLAHSLAASGAIDRGFSSDRVLMCSIHLPQADYSAAQGIAFHDRVFTRLANIAGVSSASLADNVPLTGNTPLTPVDMFPESPAGMTENSVYTNRISPGYFRTLRIPLLDGRDFTIYDGAAATSVGIVNESLARRFWPGQNAIGHRLRGGDGKWILVIGVARDSKYANLEEAAKPLLYRPLAQQYVPVATVLIQTTGDPVMLASTVRQTVANLDSNLVAYNLNTLNDRINLNLLPNRAAALTAGILGVLALALGAIGTYGIMSFMVQQRRQEIGVRIALGAAPRQVVGLVAGQGMKWTAAGLLIGLVAALGVTRLLRGILYGVSPADPVAFIGISVLLAATAYLACYIPARRASRIDPLSALRQD